MNDALIIFALYVSVRLFLCGLRVLASQHEREQRKTGPVLVSHPFRK